MDNTLDFINDRDKAFTNFILTGDKKMVIRYCKKYNIPIPSKESAFAAGIYKAALYCPEISKYVKDIAFRKCINLGYSPYIKE